MVVKALLNSKRGMADKVPGWASVDRAAYEVKLLGLRCLAGRREVLF
jgi:hypothetical protein